MTFSFVLDTDITELLQWWNIGLALFNILVPAGKMINFDYNFFHLKSHIQPNFWNGYIHGIWPFTGFFPYNMEPIVDSIKIFTSLGNLFFFVFLWRPFECTAYTLLDQIDINFFNLDKCMVGLYQPWGINV